MVVLSLCERGTYIRSSDSIKPFSAFAELEGMPVDAAHAIGSFSIDVTTINALN